jgi:transposase-like protein
MGKRKTYSAEKIIMKLREADVLIAQGKTVREVCRTLEVSEQTYYRWRNEYGELAVEVEDPLHSVALEQKLPLSMLLTFSSNHRGD